MPDRLLFSSALGLNPSALKLLELMKSGSALLSVRPESLLLVSLGKLFRQYLTINHHFSHWSISRVDKVESLVKAAF